ncbi:Methyltransferase type 11 [Metallosphaera sedula]|uniref:Methyltransferase type 11 n=3 Tax=Metallosphaera TaxID=41980 RepID=A4YFG9_METS5|nr:MULTISPECIES: class I SAM-dependent methyltransferase [Metallosphaera]ABP95171.1 Methyltransferase type 11 [Metallosphaera sedula DSM 5348]AIM27157.1 Methyltransferase type 11 [Metallosphaera sedula]AKV74059.1 methyltransferase type 11 [Metallosphaera sedula]AKV76299.1 methyltransferase type 11 [Metallosphaera sedula]AKV78550.1 methyltransferase type 11 [Metallosphaera sedula]
MVQDRKIPPFILDNPVRRAFSPPTRILDRFRDSIIPGMTVLDVGSGPGFFIPLLSRLVGEKGKVWAVDPDPRAIDRIKRKGLSNVEARVGSASSLSFLGDESVDFVFSNLVLCCLVDHKGAVDEMRRVMRRSARAYVSSRKGRGKDPRSVKEEEWKELLSKFKVIRSGSSFMEWWALVEK